MLHIYAHVYLHICFHSRRARIYALPLRTSRFLNNDAVLHMPGVHSTNILPVSMIPRPANRFGSRKYASFRARAEPAHGIKHLINTVASISDVLASSRRECTLGVKTLKTSTEKRTGYDRWPSSPDDCHRVGTPNQDLVQRWYLVNTCDSNGRGVGDRAWAPSRVNRKSAVGGCFIRLPAHLFSSPYCNSNCPSLQ